MVAQKKYPYISFGTGYKREKNRLTEWFFLKALK